MGNPFKIKFGDEEEEERELEREEIHAEDSERGRDRKINLFSILVALTIFLLALGVRLYFLYTHDSQNPGYGWYGDVYHHWQVAYLSKTVGFEKGFLRLWDLKGMEFFWGLVHPLTLIGLFSLFHTVDIVIPRLVSVIGGSLVASFVYLIIRRDFNQGAAIAAGLWAALFSVAVFSDTLGMQEQLGLVLLFAGLLAWPRFSYLTAIFWALASMTRAEYWLFSAGLVFAALFDRRQNLSSAKVILSVVYAIPIVWYMKYLYNWTGNVIFPIYWNFLASVVGKWFTNVNTPLEPMQIEAQWIGRGIFAIGVLGAVVTFWKRPKGFPFFLLGFFNVAFIGFMFGFAAYVHGFFDRFWVDRLFAFPYLFGGILLILFFLYFLPNRLSRAKTPLLIFGFFIFLIILTGSQLAWFKIMYYFKFAQASYPGEVKSASLIARYDTGEGKILFPSGRPALTYALVRNFGVSGKRLVSEMYDPYYYAKGNETKEELEQKVIWWLEGEKIKLIVYTDKSEYKTLFESHPERFKLLTQDEGTVLYEFLR